MQKAVFSFLVIVAVFSCFYILKNAEIAPGLPLCPSYEEVNRFMQSDVYKAQKAEHEKRNIF